MSLLTIQATGTEDAQIHPLVPDQNWGSGNPVGCEQAGRRIVHRFDFTSLPAGAVISNATLTWMFSAIITGDPAGGTLTIYEVTQTGWTEAGVTWNKYNGVNNWATGGGDYVPDRAATFTVPASKSDGTLFTWDVTSMVQHFQASHGNIANFLMILSGTMASRGCDFHSSEDGTVSKRPKLDITYDVPVGGSYSYFF